MVPAAGDGFTLDDLKREQILIKVTPSGYGAWDTKFDAILHFADGTSALWSTEEMTLSDYNNQEAISLSDATIAKRGLFGGFEKFGFGLLNQVGK